MPSIISAGTTAGTALSLTSDTSGELQIQTNNGATTAMTLTTGGNVGIGTNTPASKLDVVGTASFSSTMGVGDFAAASATGLNVRFIGNLTSTDITGVSVSVSAPATASNSTNGVYSSLRTTATSGSRGTLSSFYAEQPSIGAGSSVTTANGMLVRNQGNAAISNAYGIRIEVQSGSPTTNMGLFNESSSRFNGNIGLNTAPAASGTGITFPATQSASSDANTLDDYEEGTWTPSVFAGGANMVSSYNSERYGAYTKIGNTVFWMCRIDNITKNAQSGNVLIQGLPFNTSASFFGNVTIWNFSGVTTTGTMIARTNLNNSNIVLQTVTTAGVGDNILASNINGTNFNIILSGFYFV